MEEEIKILTNEGKSMNTQITELITENQKIKEAKEKQISDKEAL